MIIIAKMPRKTTTQTSSFNPLCFFKTPRISFTFFFELEVPRNNFFLMCGLTSSPLDRTPACQCHVNHVITAQRLQFPPISKITEYYAPCPRPNVPHYDSAGSASGAPRVTPGYATERQGPATCFLKI